MRIKNQVEHQNAIRAYIRATVARMVKDQKPQKDILKNIYDAIDALPQYPRSLSHDARQYFKGFYDAVIDANTCFLYCVDGAFYSVSSSKNTGFPSWDTLPRERWDGIGECGAIRYNVAPFNVF